MAGYRSYEAYKAPTFLQGKFGQAWFGALGYVKDTLADLFRQAVRARMPLVAPSDALRAIGRERNIPAGIGETDANYAQRVVGAWDAWPSAGTWQGLLGQLKATGYPGPGVVIVQALKNAYNLDASGNTVVTALGSGGWSFDPNTPNFWSKFSVLFTYPLPTRWLAGGWTSVFHSGPGTGTITPSGTPTVDRRFIVKITGSGGVGVGTYSVSRDGGATILISNQTIPASSGIGDCTLTFSGSFNAGDTYSWASSFNVPADNSSESLLIKQVVNSWKPAFATNARYIIHTSGFIYGWPANNKYGSGGTPCGFPVCYGGGSATYWSP